MRRLLTIIILAAYFSSLVVTEDVTGKCPLGSHLFHTVSSKEETAQITQQSLCPKVKQSCCDEDTYKSMNTWWDDSGDMSMNRIWLTKVQKIYKEVKLMETVYFPKVIAHIIEAKDWQERNPECVSRADLVETLSDIGAFKQMFDIFPNSVKKCWQYTINFMRGLACSTCDHSSTFYYAAKNFVVSEHECTKFTDACAEHMQIFRTFFEYIKLISGVASCKGKGMILAEEDKESFESDYMKKLDDCLAHQGGSGCMALCKKHMPFEGITWTEMHLFPELQIFLDNIKAKFFDPQWTQQSDSIVTVWRTKNEIVLQKYFQEVHLMKGGFNITDFFDEKRPGLSLERLGFSDLNEWVDKQNMITYTATIMQLSLWTVLAILGILFVWTGA